VRQPPQAVAVQVHDRGVVDDEAVVERRQRVLRVERLGIGAGGHVENVAIRRSPTTLRCS
jgi:hypothetical protein